MRPPRIVSKSWRLVLFAVASLMAIDAEAAPVTTMRIGAGTLTATLDVWRDTVTTPGFAIDFIDSFSLGTDFTVAVPQAVLDAHVLWQPSIPAQFFAFPAEWAGVRLVLSSPKVLPSYTVEALSEVCGPLPDYLDGVMIMGLRGTCSFAAKAANIQATNGAAAIIVNDIPGANAVQMSLGAFVPDILVIGLSYARGAQLVPMMEPIGGLSYLPMFDLDVRWDPDPVSVPEPSVLGLLALGLAAAGGVRRAARSSSLTTRVQSVNVSLASSPPSKGASGA